MKKVFYLDSLGLETKSRNIYAFSNFLLESGEKVAGLCTSSSTSLSLRVGEKCRPIILDPYALPGWWTRRVAKRDPRVRELIPCSAFSKDRWVLLTKGSKWIAVLLKYTTDVQHHRITLDYWEERQSDGFP